MLESVRVASERAARARAGGPGRARWSQHVEFHTPAGDPEELLVEIYDKDMHKQDDFIGRVRIPGRDLLRPAERTLPVLTHEGAAIRGHDGHITMLTIVVSSPAPPSPPHADSPEQQAASLARSPSAHSGGAGGGAWTSPRLVGHPPSAASAEEEQVALTVILKEVENLPARDASGTCDPYAVATVGGEQRFVTGVVWDSESLYARWDMECDVVAGGATGPLLVVEVMDKDRLGRDESVGRVTVDLLQLARSDAMGEGVVLEKRFPVLDESGAAVRGSNGLLTMLGLGFCWPETGPASGQAKAQGADSPANSPHPAAGRQGGPGADSAAGKGPGSDHAPKPGAAGPGRTASGTGSPADLRPTPRSAAAAAPSGASPFVQSAPQAQTALLTPVQPSSAHKSPQTAQSLPSASVAKASPSPEAKSSPASAAGPGESVQIKLLLKEVENLPKKDLMGTCNAYAVAAVGHSQRFATEVVWNSYYAEWNKEFDVEVGPAAGESLLVTVFDKDKMGKDDWIGEVRVELHLLLKNDILYAENRLFEKRYPVLDKNGAAVRGKNGFITMLALGFQLSNAAASKTTSGASLPIQLRSVAKESGQVQQSAEPARERSAPPAEDSAGHDLNPVTAALLVRQKPLKSPALQTSQAQIQSQTSPAQSAKYIVVPENLDSLPPPPRALKLLVKEAEHLPKMDVLGTCDAFATVSLGSKQRFTTDVVWNSFHAKWNKQFELQVGPVDGETLLIEVNDKDKVGKNDLIGTISIDLRPILEGEISLSEDGWLEKRYPVLDKVGVAIRGKSGYITMVTLGFNASSDLCNDAKQKVLTSQVKDQKLTVEDSKRPIEKASPPERGSIPSFVPKPNESSKPIERVTEQKNFSFEYPINLELRLHMKMESVKDIEGFKTQVVKDLAKAAAIDPLALRTSSVRAGSVIVDLELSSEARDSLGRGAQEIASGLEKQAKDGDSELLKGKCTCKTTTLIAKNVAPNSFRENEDVDAPKAANHAQRVAAKLYSENADLVGRINVLTRKLQDVDSVSGSGKSSDLTLEELVELLLIQLEEEKQSRAQADAAFDLATAEAMKHEAEKEDAIIDRDFLKNELQSQKESLEQQQSEMELVRLTASSAGEKEREARAELAKYKKESEMTIDGLAKSKDVVATLERDLHKKNTEIEKLKKDLEEQRVAIQTSESELEASKKELETSKHLSVDSSKTQDTVRQLEATNRDLQENLACHYEAAKVQEEALAASKEIEDSLKAQLNAAKEELVTTLRSHSEENNQLGVTLRALKEEKKALEKRTLELEEQLSKALPELHLLAADCERLRTALSVEQRARFELEERVQKLQERIVTLQGDLNTARVERRELEAVIAALREEMVDNEAARRERERELAARPGSAARSTFSAPPRTPATGSSARPYSTGSPAVHLFMAGALSGTPGKVAKILLGSSERHRLATSDYLASLLENTVEINRVGKGLQPEDMAEIAAYVLSHPRIERMFLSGNNLGVGGARQLADLLSRSTLKLQRLDLRHNNLGNQGCALLMEGLAANESLARLDLSANGLSPAAAGPLAEAVRASRSLVRLDLRHNELGDAGATELAEALRKGARLLHLDLSANAIGVRGAEVHPPPPSCSPHAHIRASGSA